MRSWVRHVLADLRRLGALTWRLFSDQVPAASARERIFLFSGIGVAVLILGMALIAVARYPRNLFVPSVNLPESLADRALDQPVREEPKRFKRNTYLPRQREGKTSGSVRPELFSAKFDLTQIDDPRVWWESEHDKGDTEDDHQFHRAMEEPMRRLIELVDQAGGQLKVQDAYRDKGVHARKSLHKEGRAVDLTSEEISLEKLAKLCWAAGFDWVYYEAPRSGGHHVHCSVRADRE